MLIFFEIFISWSRFSNTNFIETIWAVYKEIPKYLKDRIHTPNVNLNQCEVFINNSLYHKGPFNIFYKYQSFLRTQAVKISQISLFCISILLIWNIKRIEKTRQLNLSLLYRNYLLLEPCITFKIHLGFRNNILLLCRSQTINLWWATFAILFWE